MRRCDDGDVRKTIIAALLALASGCVEQQERHAPIGSAPVNPGRDDAQQEHQEQCGIDHDICVEHCEEREEPNNQYHCIFVVCAEGLKECRGDG